MDHDFLHAVNAVIRRVLSAARSPGDKSSVKSELNRLLDNVEAAEVRRGGAPRPEGPAAYALTCWADEILVLCLPGWSEMILEMDRYQQRLRAVRFWEKAQQALREAMKAPAQPEPRDVLEVYVLCVELGFVGNRAERDRVEGWLRGARALLFTEGHTPSPGPSGVLASPSPLTGRGWLVRSFIVLLVVSSCLLLAAIVRPLVGKRSPDGARPSPSPGGPVRHDGSSHPRHGAPTGKR